MWKCKEEQGVIENWREIAGKMSNRKLKVENQNRNFSVFQFMKTYKETLVL